MCPLVLGRAKGEAVHEVLRGRWGTGFYMHLSPQCPCEDPETYQTGFVKTHGLIGPSSNGWVQACDKDVHRGLAGTCLLLRVNTGLVAREE